MVAFLTDDLVIYNVIYNIDATIHNINTALCNLITFYYVKLYLKINANKSSFMIFCKDFPSIAVMCDYQVIAEVNQHKFLGIVIDKNLSLKPH